MRGSIVCVCLYFALGLGACGGASDEPPKPLSYHFDDMYIAAIPVDQQKGTFDAQHDWAIAKAENAKAEADYNEATLQLGNARNDVKADHLTVDSAISTKKSAEQSADMNKVNNAQRELRTAEDVQKADEARVRYLDTYRNYLRRYWRYAQENMYWHEAQFEAAKAQLAKGNNIAPKNVKYDSFPKQLDERQKRTQSSKDKAERDKQGAVTARDAWLKAQSTADTETGHPKSPWDPMAPKAGPTTAGNVTSSPIHPAIEPTPPPAPAPALQ